MKSFHHFKLRFGLTQKQGGEHLLPFFQFWIFESELMCSNSLFFTEAASRGVLQKKVFLEISQNLQENTCARDSFLIKLQA